MDYEISRFYMIIMLIGDDWIVKNIYLYIQKKIKMQDQFKEQSQMQKQLSFINYLGLESLEAALTDNITCNAYLQAIMGNQISFYGKFVLHLTIGCNCLYSLFAAQAGAVKVFCVINGHGQVQNKNLHMMQQIIRENGWDHVIEVKFFKDFNHEIDIIIGEPMGFNLIYDGLLDRMIEARDLYMRDLPKGMILPNIIRYKCAFIRDQRFIDKKVEFWNEVYGIRMKSMKHWISHQPMVRFIDPSQVVSQTAKFIDFDIKEVSYQQMDNIRRKFFIKTPIDITANGLSTWFQLQFKTSDGKSIQVKTSPFCDRTKWTQMTLYGKNTWQLKAGCQKKVEFAGKKNHVEGTTILRLKVGDENEEIYRFS